MLYEPATGYIKILYLITDPGILWDRPSMVASSVAGISPFLQGKNGYLPSIGQKGRFLVVNANKNGTERKQRTEKKWNGWNPSSNTVRV